MHPQIWRNNTKINQQAKPNSQKHFLYDSEKDF